MELFTDGAVLEAELDGLAGERKLVVVELAVRDVGSPAMSEVGVQLCVLGPVYPELKLPLSSRHNGHLTLDQDTGVLVGHLVEPHQRPPSDFVFVLISHFPACQY